MILVDSSVWISALRQGDGREAVALRGLLDRDEVALAMPVRLELLGGASREERGTLRRLLSALPLWVPTEATWWRVDSWLQPAAEAGERFGIADLVIAATAAEREAAIWSLDEDFARMARLDLVEVFDPATRSRA